MRLHLQNLADTALLVERFRAALPDHEPRKMLRKFVIFGHCYVFPSPDDQYELLHDVAQHFDVHPANIVIVGSAKLGFSIVPAKRYRAFNDKSDVDVTIVDTSLFERICWEIHEASEARFYWPKRTDFATYLMRGWIRPDMFPDIRGPTVNSWWTYFNSLSRRVGLRVRGAVYRDWRYFESYHLLGVVACSQAGDLAAEPPAPR